MKLPVSPPAYDRYMEQQRSGVIERSFTDMQAQVTGLRWDDQKAEFRGLAIPSVCLAATFDPTLPGWLFPSTGGSVYGGATTFQLDHAYAEGTPIRPHVHWCKVADGDGDVEWILQYKWAKIGEVTVANWTEVKASAPVGETPDLDTADYQMLTPFGEIPADDIHVSDLLICRLLRDPGATNDTYVAGDARMMYFDLHIQKDDRGSYKLHSKR